MGLVASAVLAQCDAVKGLAMVALGLLLGIVGTDVNSGIVRYGFGVPELFDGIGFTVIAVGLFAVAEIVVNLESREPRQVFTGAIPRLMPSRDDLKDSSWPAVRGTAVGALFGVLPGTGPALSSFAAYMLEKKLARDPSRFGRGAIEGVAAPEAANNAAAQTGFIPTLTLGIPGTPIMALMVGAMIMQGLSPGPQVMAEKPELFWGIVASMWIGNLMLVVLNLPLVGLWVRLLRCLTAGSSLDRHILRDRQLQREQIPGRCVLCAVPARSGYRARQARVRAGAAVSPCSGRCSGSTCGAQCCSRAATLAVLHPADQPGVHARHRAPFRRDDRAGAAREKAACRVAGAALHPAVQRRVVRRCTVLGEVPRQ
jgi:hypothetical protein